MAQANSPEDIINLILQDHKPLKELIKIMKDDEATPAERKQAFKKFAPLLVRHAKPEEQTWYVAMKKDDDTREEGLEGDVEHGLADQMAEEAKRTEDEDLLLARIKVLAELVEHHIEEEEEEMLPDYRENSELEERIEWGFAYLEAQTEIDAMGDDDAPHENSRALKSEKESSLSRH